MENYMNPFLSSENNNNNIFVSNNSDELYNGLFNHTVPVPVPVLSHTVPVPVVPTSIENNGCGEFSDLTQNFVEPQPVCSAPAIWDNLYANITNLVGPKSQSDLLKGSLPIDHTEFNENQLPPYTNAQLVGLTDALQIHQKELNGIHGLNMSPFASGLQMNFNNKTGTLQNSQPSQQLNEENLNSNQTNNNLNANNQLLANRANNVSGFDGTFKPRVRARRGQATDPHSIAERLRREKISERMKNLQELVPNSNKTDKASMLDEIIDYVKFLQLQVKVLSMSRLGATEAVVPLITESQAEGSGSVNPPASTGKLEQSEPPQDSLAFEHEVIRLMESNVTSAMQYLQNKGLCLMPIALASAISGQKGASSAAILIEKRKN